MSAKAVEKASGSALVEYEAKLERLARRVQALEETLEAIRVLGEDFWRNEAAAYLLATGRDSWAYRAENPTALTENMFLPQYDEGKAKRWVSGVGAVEVIVPIVRLMPLTFVADLPAFVTHAVAETLTLAIDDEPVEWTRRNIDGIWTAQVPERANAYSLKFKLAVRTDLIPAGTDASFAIRSLSISPV